jgi:hypothetical protein
MLLFNAALTGELVCSLWCRVSDLNDNAPVFLGTPYSITIPENTAPNTTVFRNRIPLEFYVGMIAHGILTVNFSL